MKLLYIDCSMGAAGDMLAGALFDLLPEFARADLLQKLNDNLAGHAEVRLERGEKGGITGTHFRVLVHGREEGHDSGDEPEEQGRSNEYEKTDAHVEHTEGHSHTHGHGSGMHMEQHGHAGEGAPHHGHHHEHHSLADIFGIIDGFTFSENVKKEIREVYERIALSESRVHGRPVGEIHFHEVGAMDAVADISAACLAMDALGADRIVASPIVTGFGTVRCAHGLLPVPAPATAELLTGLPTSAGNIEGELCTPTGAALIGHFADAFGVRPDMVVRGIGRGTGTKDFSRPNILQVFLGESEPDSALTDQIIELSCNLDDMTGEEIGFAAQMLLEKGALDVWTESIQMKKFRPGTLLTLLCRPEEEDVFVRLLFRYTTTLGVRKTLHERYVLARKEEPESISTDSQSDTPPSVRKKTSRGYGVTRSKYEYDDLAEIARKTGQPLREVRESLTSG